MVGGKTGAQSKPSVLSGLIGEDYLRKEDALQIARLIFYENAQSLYQ